MLYKIIEGLYCCTSNWRLVCGLNVYAQVFRRFLRILIKFPRIGSLNAIWKDKQYATFIHGHNQVIMACGNHTSYYVQIDVVKAAKWAKVVSVREKNKGQEMEENKKG